jgi:hypothetical protein
MNSFLLTSGQHGAFEYSSISKTRLLKIKARSIHPRHFRRKNSSDVERKIYKHRTKLLFAIVAALEDINPLKSSLLLG